MKKTFALLLAALPLTAMADEITTADVTFEGKVVTIKGVVTDNGTETAWYITNDGSQLKMVSESAAASDFAKGTAYNYYWVVSKNPTNSKYYLSSYRGDAYLGFTAADALVGTGTSSVPAWTDKYNNEFEYIALDKKGKATNSNASADAVVEMGENRYAIRYPRVTTSGSTTTEETKWLAINKNGELNWMNYTCKLFNSTWSTEFEIKEVTQIATASEESVGSLSAPTEYGWKVTLTRSNDGAAQVDGEDYNYYATLRLPFAVELPEGMKAYKLSKKSNIDNTLVGLTEHKNEVTTTVDGTSVTRNILARETPVLLCVERTADDADISKTYYLRPQLAQTITDTGFNGSLGKKTFTNEVYAGITDSLTYYILTKSGGRVAFRPMQNQTIAANKAFYEWRPSDASSAAPAALTFFFTSDDDEATAITRPTLPTATATDAPIYDLTGRRIATPTRPGIYIRDGKKFVVR